MKGVYTKAILNCNEAIKLQPTSVRSYLYRLATPSTEHELLGTRYVISCCFNRGALKYHIKAYELAIRDLTHAISIDNRCPVAYFNRAVCYQDSGDWQKVMFVF